MQEMLQALKCWNRCKEWRKDGNEFVPGLHRWIKLRQWENLPEDVKVVAPSRYRHEPKPLPERLPEDEVVTPEEVAAMFREEGFLRMTRRTELLACEEDRELD